MKRVLRYALPCAVVLFLLGLVVGSLAQHREVLFSDVPPDHWAARAVGNLQSLGVLRGRAGGAPRLAREAPSRAEMVQLTSSAVGVTSFTSQLQDWTRLQAEQQLGCCDLLDAGTRTASPNIVWKVAPPVALPPADVGKLVDGVRKTLGDAGRPAPRFDIEQEKSAQLLQMSYPADAPAPTLNTTVALVPVAPRPGSPPPPEDGRTLVAACSISGTALPPGESEPVPIGPATGLLWAQVVSGQEGTMPCTAEIELIGGVSDPAASRYFGSARLDTRPDERSPLKRLLSMKSAAVVSDSAGHPQAVVIRSEHSAVLVAVVLFSGVTVWLWVHSQ